MLSLSILIVENLNLKYTAQQEKTTTTKYSIWTQLN